LVVHHRVRRTWRGSGSQETLDIFTEAVEEVRAAAPDVEAIGFGNPALVDWRPACRAGRTTCRSTTVPFRDLMSERLGLPVVVDNDGNASLLAEARTRAAAGCAARGDDLAGHRDRRGPVAERRRLPRRVRARRRAGHACCSCTARVPGRLSRVGLLRGARVGDAIGARARGRGGGAGLGAGTAAAAEQEIDGGIVTEMAHDGDRSRARCSA
jgi:glucokinase